MGEKSAEYFLRRECAERAAAAAASSPVVRDVHLEMAERYAAEAEHCRRQLRRSEAQPGQPMFSQLGSSFGQTAATGSAPTSPHRSTAWWR